MFFVLVILRGVWLLVIFFFQAEDGIRDVAVTGVQTCALPIYAARQHKVDAELAVADEAAQPRQALADFLGRIARCAIDPDPAGIADRRRDLDRMREAEDRMLDPQPAADRRPQTAHRRSP